MGQPKGGNTPEVFIVEDEGIIALDLQFKLRDLGYDVSRTASSGQEALRLMGEKLPDLVLMDIVLQGTMDGVETTREIKKRYDVPVVYLTASSDTSTLDRTLETDPAGYIHKPFNETNLRYTLEIALYKHRAEQQIMQKDRELEKAKRELQVKSDLLQGILDHSPSLIHAKNPEGTYKFINKRYAELYGLTYEEVIGRTTYDLFPLDLAEYMISQDKEVMASRKPIVYEHTVRLLPDKRWCTIKFPLFDERGEIVAVCGISTEIQSP